MVVKELLAPETAYLFVPWNIVRMEHATTAQAPFFKEFWFLVIAAFPFFCMQYHWLQTVSKMTMETKCACSPRTMLLVKDPFLLEESHTYSWLAWKTWRWLLSSAMLMQSSNRDGWLSSIPDSLIKVLTYWTYQGLSSNMCMHVLFARCCCYISTWWHAISIEMFPTFSYWKWRYQGDIWPSGMTLWYHACAE